MLQQRLDKIAELLTTLRDSGAVGGFALAGGLAVSAWSPPRATMDIDLLVIVEGDRLQHLVQVLTAAGFNAELRRGGFDDPIPCLIRADALDIIVASKQYEAEAVAKSIVVSFAGRDIPVVSPEYLIILKLKAGGPRDLLDVREILAFGLVDRRLLAELAARYGVEVGEG